MSFLQKLNLPQMCLALSLLGAYSASIYKVASTHDRRTHVVDIPLASSTDVEKILDVVEPRESADGDVSNYLPGVACIIEAGPDTTVEKMEEFFSECLADHYDFINRVPFIE